MSRRNLVIVRAGNSSLHEGWLPPVGAPRSWDCVVSYFGDDPSIYKRPDVVRIDGKGPKWGGLHNLLVSDAVDWRAYDRIWLPDDDLAATPAAVERFFAIVQDQGLWLAQPSLSHDSYISHAATAHHEGVVLRRTNFVEAMAPVFTPELLERVLPTLTLNDSGWGIDYLWQMYLDRPRLDSAIVDAVQIRHTRPVGGPNYERMKAEGRSPMVELVRLRRRFNFDPQPLCWSALLDDGRELRIDEHHDALELMDLLLARERRWLDEEGIGELLRAHMACSAPLRALAKRPAAAPVVA
jgi:hypothetical protein